jgi:choline dehydrogenase-like flavoprotein
MMEIFGHTAGLMTLGEQLPVETNAVDLDPEIKDQYGMPVPRVNIEWHSNEKAMISEMEKDIREIFDAAGATRIFPRGHSTPGNSVHNMGTCRMGGDPKFSVLNSFCQSHDVPNLFVVDGSCFVTGGTANPSLTIQALAVRASEFITREAKKGNLWTGRMFRK